MSVTAPTDDDLVMLEKCERIEKRVELEHSLATTFVTLQRERVPEERERLWRECQRLASELEKLQ